MRKVKKISLFLLSLLLLSSNTSLNDYNFQDKVQVKQKIEHAKSSQLTTENAKSTNSNYSICDYAPTKKTSTTINNISAGSVINSDRWRVGLIEHWNEVTIKSLYKVEGVYSTFQFFARQVLESGNGELSYRQNLNYQTTSGFSFYFDRTDALYIMYWIVQGLATFVLLAYIFLLYLNLSSIERKFRYQANLLRSIGFKKTVTATLYTIYVLIFALIPYLIGSLIPLNLMDKINLEVNIYFNAELNFFVKYEFNYIHFLILIVTASIFIYLKCSLKKGANDTLKEDRT